MQLFSSVKWVKCVHEDMGGLAFLRPFKIFLFRGHVLGYLRAPNFREFWLGIVAVTHR